jgi:hypothetical protein
MRRVTEWEHLQQSSNTTPPINWYWDNQYYFLDYWSEMLLQFPNMWFWPMLQIQPTLAHITNSPCFGPIMNLYLDNRTVRLKIVQNWNLSLWNHSNRTDQANMLTCKMLNTKGQRSMWTGSLNSRVQYSFASYQIVASDAAAFRLRLKYIYNAAKSLHLDR